ncbi:7097_t:CDS:1, partial [Paraglomus brasilianum]
FLKQKKRNMQMRTWEEEYGIYQYHCPEDIQRNDNNDNGFMPRIDAADDQSQCENGDIHHEGRYVFL